MITDFQLAMARLDEALTGKTEHFTEHTASTQAGTPEQWYLDSERAWYLSDGGYSRVCCEDNGRLFLASVSRDEVKARWTDAVFQRQEVERQLITWLRSQGWPV
jgi:hypothetical protein